MSPELEDTLRKLVRELGIEKTHQPNSNTRAALDAVAIAIARTIFELREPKP